MMNQPLKYIALGILLSSISSSATAKTEHDEYDHTTPIENHSEENERHDEHDQEHGNEDESEDKHNHENHNEGEHDEEDHDEREHKEDDHDEGIKLSPKQAALANINVAVLNARMMDYQVYAPGEIKANGYTSYLVSPRVDSVVLRRHVSLGDHVKKGQALVTLFSETVAEAQAAFRVANSEWRRAKNLGRKAIGDRRFITAQTDYEASYGRLLAYGLSKEAIQSLAKKSQALGEYTLIAANAGAVLTDDFHQGQRVESGAALIKLADEQALWVEARLTPTLQLSLPAGTQAKINVGNEWFSAQVTQEAHTIDPETRTRVVRLLVQNEADRLHPGLFTDVYFSFMTETPVLAVPEAALMRSADGDWTVFVEEQPGQFKAQEIELGRSLGHQDSKNKWREITGIRSGSRVVMEGAFFVASQIAKGGFDPHNH